MRNSGHGSRKGGDGFNAGYTAEFIEKLDGNARKALEDEKLRAWLTTQEAKDAGYTAEFTAKLNNCALWVIRNSEIRAWLTTKEAKDAGYTAAFVTELNLNALWVIRNSEIRAWLTTPEAKDAGYTAAFVAEQKGSAREALEDETLRAWLQKGGAGFNAGYTADIIKELNGSAYWAIKTDDIRIWLMTPEAKDAGYTAAFVRELNDNAFFGLDDKNLRPWLTTKEAKDSGYTAERIAKLSDSAIEALQDEKLRAWLITQEAKDAGYTAAFVRELNLNALLILMNDDIRTWLMTPEAKDAGYTAAFVAEQKGSAREALEDETLRAWLQKGGAGFNAGYTAAFIKELNDNALWALKSDALRSWLTTQEAKGAGYTVAFIKELNDNALWALKSDALRSWLTTQEAKGAGYTAEFIAKLNDNALWALKNNNLRVWLTTQEAKDAGYTADFIEKLGYNAGRALRNNEIRAWLTTQEAKDAGYTADFIEKLGNNAFWILKDDSLRAWLQKDGAGFKAGYTVDKVVSIFGNDIDTLRMRRIREALENRPHVDVQPLKAEIQSLKEKARSDFLGKYDRNRTLSTGRGYELLEWILPYEEFFDKLEEKKVKISYEKTKRIGRSLGFTYFFIEIGGEEIKFSDLLLSKIQNAEEKAKLEQINEIFGWRTLNNASPLSKELVNLSSKTLQNLCGYDEETLKKCAAYLEKVSTNPNQRSVDWKQRYDEKFVELLGTKFTFGVEVEQFGFRKTNQPEYEHVVGNVILELMSPGTRSVFDSSIRPSSNRKDAITDEIVSPILGSVDSLTGFLNAVDFIYRNGGEVNESCGLHVHIGFQNLKTPESWKPEEHGYEAGQEYVKNTSNYPVTPFQLEVMKRFAINYARYCQTTVGKITRESNAYAKAIEEKDLSKAENNNVKSVDDFKACWGRYYTVNVEALDKHGTIECRQHDGTTDPTKILGWVKTLSEIAEISEQQVKEAGKGTKSLGEEKKLYDSSTPGTYALSPPLRAELEARAHSTGGGDGQIVSEKSQTTQAQIIIAGNLFRSHLIETKDKLRNAPPPRPRTPGSTSTNKGPGLS